MSGLAHDQIQIGKWLATQDRLLITRNAIEPLGEGQRLNRLTLPIFGYHVLFTGPAEIKGKFGDEARSGNLLRAWDFSLPDAESASLWKGYARRPINAHVPRFSVRDLEEARHGKYEGLDDEDRENERLGAPKTLNHLALDDRKLNSEDKPRWIGAEALITLKGDVDNLGLIFQAGLARPTFAKMSALSRQMNAFFAVWLPWVCAREYPDTYTVFAGGDDFFLIGPWHSTIKLAARMRDEFSRYVAANPDIHFSAGLSITKPGLPIRQLGMLADEALAGAKEYNANIPAVPPKNAVSCYGHVVDWATFRLLLDHEQAVLSRLASELGLSTGYLYDLLRYADMAGAVKERPENALWHSRFAYRTWRMLENRKRLSGDERRRLQQQLGAEIAAQGIENHGAAYKIALYTHLYQQRD